MLKGIPVSPGIAIGAVFVLDEQRKRVARRTVAPGAVSEEVARLEGALKASRDELMALHQTTKVDLGDEAAKIFAFHLGMLSDPSLTRPMRSAIEQDLLAAEFAVFQSFQTLIDRFAAMKDAAFRTKVDDVRDLSARVLKHLIGAHVSRMNDIDAPVILIARDLTPSQTMGFRKGKVLGFVTATGGKTGHVGIFAQAMQIPAVVGTPRVMEQVVDGVLAILDGETGSVIVDPDEATLAEYRALQERSKLFQVALNDLALLPCVTLDGTPVDLLGNIGTPEEISDVLAAGGQGVGLYRTEYLYLAREQEPTEEEHYNAYARCIELLGGKPITIRTMDLGADKYAKDLEAQEAQERNPMLGRRSIRLCLANLPMFKTQLRALLRAAALAPAGSVKIMFPLVTNVEELKRAKFFVNDVIEDLRDERVEHDGAVKIGMMVEVPSAAIMADAFAREAAFFSIGTNDLVQYTLAVDRTNELVADMYNPANPAVIQLVKRVIDVGKSARIPVSCCGEAAGELEQVMLLLGLGLRTLSASPMHIPAVKRLIRSVSISQCEAVAEKAASIDSDVAVSRFLRDQTRKIMPEAFGGRSVGDEPVAALRP
ncbi:phosphoenolpyruvate--protein phosphotransferase [soil metagenome]